MYSTTTLQTCKKQDLSHLTNFGHPLLESSFEAVNVLFEDALTHGAGDDAGHQGVERSSRQKHSGGDHSALNLRTRLVPSQPAAWCEDLGKAAVGDDTPLSFRLLV